MRLQLFIGLFLTILFFSCEKVIFKDIQCRDFQLTGEHYWFPLPTGDSVVFINTTTNTRKKYTVANKQITHRTKYTSDTGCGCFDNSKMLLTSGSDSLWFNNELKYVENNEGNYYEDIFFVINDKQSGFYETSKTHLDTYTLDSTTFSDVEFFECKECVIDLSVKKLYRAKNYGVISFELVNGEIWINENLTTSGISTTNSFDYSEDTCE